MTTRETNELTVLIAPMSKSVTVEGPGADQTHVVGNKLKGIAVDTRVKKICALGEDDQSR
jgi:hypothetical protein